MNLPFGETVIPPHPGSFFFGGMFMKKGGRFSA